MATVILKETENLVAQEQVIGLSQADALLLTKILEQPATTHHKLKTGAQRYKLNSGFNRCR